MKLDALLHWYETLTPETIPHLNGLYHEQARFHDPFNDVRGHEAITVIFPRTQPRRGISQCAA